MVQKILIKKIKIYIKDMWCNAQSIGFNFTVMTSELILATQELGLGMLIMLWSGCVH